MKCPADGTRCHIYCTKTLPYFEARWNCPTCDGWYDLDHKAARRSVNSPGPDSTVGGGAMPHSTRTER